MPLIENLCCRETKLTQLKRLKKKKKTNRKYHAIKRQIWKLQTVNALTTVRGVNELHSIDGQVLVREG